MQTKPGPDVHDTHTGNTESIYGAAFCTVCHGRNSARASGQVSIDDGATLQRLQMLWHATHLVFELPSFERTCHSSLVYSRFT